MKRQLLVPLVLASLLAPLAASRAAEVSHPPGKPNLIFILIDDMGYGDIGPFGSTKNSTPNLDRMAREGMKLTSFYAAPVCTPSRAQVLTGCYAKRVSLPEVIFPAAGIGLNPKELTVADLLRSQGYATMCIGKWHVGDAPEVLPLQHGFDHYFGLPYSNDMGGEEAPANGKRRGPPPLPLLRDHQVIETVSPRQQDRLEARYTDEALKFIRQNQARPFFLYFPHTAVHTPIHPGDQFKGRSANGPYGDWVLELDWSVGQVLDTLRELKLAQNTLVLFSSDNGPWLGHGNSSGSAGPLRGGKFTTFEGGLREPTLAWWPGRVPAGSTCDAVTGNMDVLPTFAALAGANLPPGVKIDGRNILPILFGQTQQSPHEAFYYFNGNRLDAVRSGPWKLTIASRDRKPKNTGVPPLPFKPILNNLDQDIGETNDVAAEHPEVVERLQKFVTVMDADLGTNELGPGVRAPYRVAHPTGLWLPGHGPGSESAPK